MFVYAMPKVITKFPIRYAECRKEEHGQLNDKKRIKDGGGGVEEEPDKLANMDLEETHQTK